MKNKLLIAAGWRPAPAFAGVLVLMLSATPSWASDLAKEQRWADQIVDELFDGEAVWLDSGGTRFLGIFTEATSDAKGSVVVLHGIGVHPDWPEVINPLRVGLAEAGWNTLSVQLPILPNEAQPEEYLPLFPEAPPRVDAAVGFLRNAGTGPVFIVAHSMGTTMALRFIAAHPDAGVSGLVLVGTNTGGAGGLDEPAAGLRGVVVPILDLYGERDLEPVLTGVGTRAEVATASDNRDFTQIEVAGADHFFNGYEDDLLDTVSEWLEARR